MKRLTQRLVYLALRAVIALLSFFPLPILCRIGGIMGFAAWVLLPKYRKLALSNVRIAFGEEKTDQELRALVRKSFCRLGSNLLAVPVMPQLDRAAIDRIVTLDGESVIRDAVKDGRPVVVTVMHLGNWELTTQLSFWFEHGAPAGTVFQPLRNPYIDAWVRRIRQARGILLFDRAEGFLPTVEHLRKGGFLGILADQHAGDAGLWLPFFGRLASTTTLPALIAKRTGALLVPTAAPPLAPGKWQFVFGKPVDPEGLSVQEITMRLNEGMEALIRKSPENWFWLHQRWKTPSPKFLLSTYRRGVFVPEHIRLKPFRILIRSVNWLGDCVMTVPAVQAIKKGRPDAHVTILCAAKLAEFWRLLPEVDEVLVFEPGDTVFKVARKVRAGRFDVAVLFPNSLRSALEVSTVPRRVGFAGHSRRRLLNQIVPKLSERKKNPILRPVHQVNHYLAIAERIGARLEWDFPPELRDLPVNESTSPHPRILVCPGAEYGPAKRWLPERFAAVITEVSRRRECGWFLVGTSRDREITAEIAGKAEGNVTDLAGKTSLTELMIHLRSADLLLTNDTGTMHLASMLGTPVLAIFGSTEPVLTGPMGEKSVVLRHQVECSPCFLRTCPLDFRCMKAVEVDEVVEAVIRATDAPPVHTAAGAKN